MTTCDFCGMELPLRPSQAQVLVRDQNGYTASEYDACDPCGVRLVEVLKVYKANKGRLRQAKVPEPL